MAQNNSDADLDADPAKRDKSRAMAAIAVLPTLFTLGNLLCGFVAVFLASRPIDAALPWGWSPLTFAAVAIFLGMVFDGLDGRIARRTGMTSDIGEQLDSMADMVTFGVAPAFIAVQLVGVETPFLSERGDQFFDRLALVIACIYVACTALRLARFNIELGEPEEATHDSFKGLPSPGAAGTVASLVLLHQHFLAHRDPTHWSIGAASIGMVAVTALVAWAMVSRVRYVHVMNRYFRGRAPFQRIVLIVVITLLLLTKPQVTMAATSVCYAVSAPLFAIMSRIRHRKLAE